jgi:hypothetical protein
LVDDLIHIGLLDMSVYKEVQYEAQVDHLRQARFLALRDERSARGHA